MTIIGRDRICYDCPEWDLDIHECKVGRREEDCERECEKAFDRVI